MIQQKQFTQRTTVPMWLDPHDSYVESRCFKTCHNRELFFQFFDANRALVPCYSDIIMTHCRIPEDIISSDDIGESLDYCCRLSFIRADIGNWKLRIANSPNPPEHHKNLPYSTKETKFLPSSAVSGYKSWQVIQDDHMHNTHGFNQIRIRDRNHSNMTPLP